MLTDAYMRPHTWLPRLAVTMVVLASAACSGGVDTGDSDSALITDLLKNKEEFFASEMLYVSISGWDGAKMTPASLRDESSTKGAQLAIYQTKADSDLACPDKEVQAKGLIYKSNAFTLRTSGNMTNGTPKSSYKVSLEDKNDRLWGMKKLNLKSMWNDVSQMRESIAWSIFREAGVPAPHHTYAKFCINGKYFGLYSLIEQVDKAMLKDHFGKNNDGNLYKGYWVDEKVDIGPATLGYRKQGSDDSGRAYFKSGVPIDQRSYRLSTNDDPGDPGELKTYDDLATLIRVHSGLGIQGSGDAKFNTPEYKKSLEAVFNVKGFLRWAAVNSLLGSWDNYYATPANYYIYNSGPQGDSKGFMKKPYFTWIPWDYDNSFGIDFFGRAWQHVGIMDWVGYNGQSNMGSLPLLKHIFANDDYVRYYLDAIEWINDTLFTDGAVSAKVAKLVPRVQKAAFQEGNFSSAPQTGRQFNNDEVFNNGFQHNELRRGSMFILGIKHYVIMRHASVADQVARLRAERKMPRGSSGGTFPPREEPLP